MMSLTGNKRGFTLVEVMAATVILSLGLLAIYKSFFLSLDTFNYYTSYLEGAAFANEKIWEAEEGIRQFGGGALLDTAGSFKINYSNFNWGLDYYAVGESPYLYKIDFNLSLKRGNKFINLSRCAYALYEEKK